MPDSVSTYSESILMLDADTRLYPEKDGGRVFHAARDAPEAFSADQLEQKPVQAAERMSGLLEDEKRKRERKKQVNNKYKLPPHGSISVRRQFFI